MRFVKLLVLFCVVMGVSPIVKADEVTHAIGTTGYMIREAMQAGARYAAKDAYQTALRLQRDAKMYMRGTHKDGRSVARALELTERAYHHAKVARDQALANQID